MNSSTLRSNNNDDTSGGGQVTHRHPADETNTTAKEGIANAANFANIHMCQDASSVGKPRRKRQLSGPTLTICDEDQMVAGSLPYFRGTGGHLSAVDITGESSISRSIGQQQQVPIAMHSGNKGANLYDGISHRDDSPPHRRRKAFRGIKSDPIDDIGLLQRKQGLLDRLNRAYGTGSNDEEELDDDYDEGDVSGEDVFSEDEDENQGSEFVCLKQPPELLGYQSSMPPVHHQYSHQSHNHSYQPQNKHIPNSNLSSKAAPSESDPVQHSNRLYHFNYNEKIEQPSNNHIDHAASSATPKGLFREQGGSINTLHQDLGEPKKKEDDNDRSSKAMCVPSDVAGYGKKQPDLDSKSDVATHNQKQPSQKLSSSNTLNGSSDKASKSKRKSPYEIFTNINIQASMLHEYNERLKGPKKPDTDSQQKESPPSASPSFHRKTSKPQEHEAPMANGGESARENSFQSLAQGPCKTNKLAKESHSHSRNIIANMEAVMSRKVREDAVIGGQHWRSSEKPRAGFRSFRELSSTNGRNERAIRSPSREVIASIEADMMRLQAEEDMEEENALNQHIDTRVSSGPTHGGHQPAGMNERDAMHIMMMQHQQRSQAVSLHAAAVGHNGVLSDQIAQNDDDISAKSINSCVSYDGKNTGVIAIRAQTQDQELACHELNNAICDLYGAPVKRILRQYPSVTRLVRADDGTGNVQLHYAVKFGNVKAIRRIIRVDPGCALIRNVQGYCPLHFAVLIGNFSAVQLLCSMVPAAAEVQCEEGCLPLHEAVSSAAHLPDAPQITAALINAFPSAIKITNDEGLLPLHLAAMSGFSAGIRTIFAYGFNTIYARENTEEMLPLDFAIDGYKTSNEENMDQTEVSDNSEKEREFRQCIDIFLMSALYDRPVFTHARNDQPGIFLPIHGAVAAQPSTESWRQIVSMYGQDFASDVDVRGRTALHVLMSSKLMYLHTVTEMIKNISEMDTTNATTYDDSGFIPLHVALVHLVPFPVIEYLLSTNLSTISMEVDDDCDVVEYRNMLPFQLAAACGCGVDVVNLLLRAHPIGVAGALTNEGS